MNRRTWYLLIAAAVAGLAAIQVFVSLPGDRWYWRDLQNLGHVPLYAAIGILLFLLARRLPVLADRPARQYWAAGTGSLAVGVAAEGIQAVGLGDADLFDILRDLSGIIPALLLIHVVLNRRQLTGVKKRLLVALAAIVAAFSLLPIGYSSYCALERARLFPVLIDFDADWQGRFVKGDDAQLNFAAPPPAWSLAGDGPVGEVIFSDSGYPGLAIDEPAPDWSGFERLRISVFNPGDSLGLTVRIDDRRHNGEFEDRFNERYYVAPGADTITVALAAVRRAPTGRDLDLTDIQKVMLFTRPGATRLYVDKIWLE